MHSCNPSGGGDKERSGFVFSMMNGAIVNGLGVMLDLGVVEDKNGEAAGYSTIGFCIGYGGSIGTGVAYSKNLDLNDFFGVSIGFNGTIPLLKPIFGAEGFVDVTTGTEGHDYYGTNYNGVGGNIGYGKAWYLYISYTCRLYPVDNNFWIRSCRR